MVEQKELVTLFKIEKLTDEIETIKPFEVVDGIYNEENRTFMTSDGMVYPHIESTEYPNIGFAKRIIMSIDMSVDSSSPESLDLNKIKRLNTESIYTYLRFNKEIDRIYIKSVYSNGIKLMEDIDSKRNEKSTEEQPSYIGIDKTPKEIYDEVRKTIKGQDEAIKMIATCLWATINGRTQKNEMTKKQMMVIGPTGVGKTAIFRKIQKILDTPVIIFSVSGLSQAGYKGRDTDEILKQVYYECDENIDLAEKAIVVLDEYDKLAYKGADKSGDVSTIGVQYELLKMMEGCTRLVEIDPLLERTFTIDTSDMIFITSGAFQELFEEKSKPIGYCTEKSLKKEVEIDQQKLVDYGIIRESVGWLPIIVRLNSLTREIYREIILKSDESELLAHIDFLQSLDVQVKNINQIVESIIDDAISKDIGARGLVATISKMFVEVIYEVANHPGLYSEVIIGKNIINDPNDFELVKRQIVKKRMKTISSK